ncbi:MAG: hypothetical protein HC800_04935 [Phormidesmis sp. RL_2_1]|nr:hypothetical protein [Phormidesmis sp. RL_2_1]
MSADKQTRSQKPRKNRSDFQRLSRRFMSGLLRSLFLINKPARSGQAGFVLPTTVLLLLVLSLTVGALSFRTFSRSGSVIAQREQQVIDNAAAPTIDRAKAKLEYLFSKDTRFPGGVPSSDVIASMLLNDGNNGIPTITENDPYTFPDEKRININAAGGVDNAWVFPSDVNGNGQIEPGELVAYSMLMDDESGSVKLTDSLSAAKAKALVTRNGPINTAERKAGCGSARAPEGGWQVISSATLQKNFQVTSFVASNNAVNRTVSALEFQQVRQASRGNKWGAWFKYDLELFPGSDNPILWNGAMHTDGNLLIRDAYTARMISSEKSCLYTQDASEVTLATDSNFTGQVISGKSGTNAFDGANAVNYHLFTSDNAAPDVTNGALSESNDSITGSSAGIIRDILLDPISLFTKDTLSHRGTGTWSHDNTWDTSAFVNKKRVYNENTATPYLDDTYRADNRYGPKPRYDVNNAVPPGTSVGAPIPAANVALTAQSAASSAYGLDGYWERRAIGQGLRLIVGQRLELGDAFGWTGNNEPLYPVDNPAVTSEARQRRSLYDNLAAVQGMVVYHYQNSNPEYPLACIANTAHPGTRDTIINSRNFKAQTFKDSANNDITLISNFLTGKGTNGWEYDFPTTFLPSTGGTPESFGAALATNRPLGTALRNLARFAGDPNGGAPSFIPVQESGGAVVHPFPQMAMWGDYSILRRIFDERLDNTSVGTIEDRYNALSPADKSSLHSAACTMGLLSNNLNNLSRVDWEKSRDAGTSGVGTISTQGQVKGVGGRIWDIFIASSTLTTKYCKADPPSSTTNFVCEINPTKEELLAIEKNTTGTKLSENEINFVDSLSDFTQVQRDRTYGFEESPDYVPPSSSIFSSSWSAQATGGGSPRTYNFKFPANCHPGSPSSAVNALFNPTTINPNSDNARDAAGVALVCSTQPKYPALYYLFPLSRHDQNDGQPATEEYLNDKAQSGVSGAPATNYIFNDDNTGVNGSVTYQVIGDTNQNGTIDTGEFTDAAALESIAFKYRVTGTPATGQQAWKLPRTTTTTDFQTTATPPVINLDPESMQVGGPDGKLLTVALLDKGMFDGRELLGLRMLDLDVAQLASGTSGSDRWISTTDGIVYAFREDAVREDAIVRPKSSNAAAAWDKCNTWAQVYKNESDGSVVGNNRDCRMRKLAAAPYLQDPALTADTTGAINISTKPIDFYPDPDRRPHGFRLMNGASLGRGPNVQSGMTFVSDNIVYTKGHFNLHITATNTLGANCSNLLEEFTQKLIKNDCSRETANNKFYGGTGGRVTLNDTIFAYSAATNNANNDSWRPIEIVGDAVGVLSGNFRDGNMQDSFTIPRTLDNNVGRAVSSYQNQNRLLANAQLTPSALKHANPSDVESPMVINRNGQLVRSNDAVVPESDFFKFSASDSDFSSYRGGDMEQANFTIANAVFISGIVPSQAGQTYGGMHNFPRFIEQWKIQSSTSRVASSSSALAPLLLPLSIKMLGSLMIPLVVLQPMPTPMAMRD